MTRLELLERVNTLNMHAQAGERYWTCTVLYNTVIWCQHPEQDAVMHEVINGVPK
jgi:hypothetical protein